MEESTSKACAREHARQQVEGHEVDALRLERVDLVLALRRVDQGDDCGALPQARLGDGAEVDGVDDRGGPGDVRRRADDLGAGLGVPASEKPLASPAPDCTTIRAPSFARAPTVSGVAHTRVSEAKPAGATSFRTPTTTSERLRRATTSLALGA